VCLTAELHLGKETGPIKTQDSRPAKKSAACSNQKS